MSGERIHPPRARNLFGVFLDTWVIPRLCLFCVNSEECRHTTPLDQSVLQKKRWAPLTQAGLSK
jgi:hypothetical protein